jgi:hypothetical protein
MLGEFVLKIRNDAPVRRWKVIRFRDRRSFVIALELEAQASVPSCLIPSTLQRPRGTNHPQYSR